MNILKNTSGDWNDRLWGWKFGATQNSCGITACYKNNNKNYHRHLQSAVKSKKIMKQYNGKVIPILNARLSVAILHFKDTSHLWWWINNTHNRLCCWRLGFMVFGRRIYFY